MHAEPLNCHANVDQLALKLGTTEKKEVSAIYVS
jgi:hypothetical protein